jgi:23S rRNA (guanosine2251-2'-O)-methyltransferase
MVTNSLLNVHMSTVIYGFHAVIGALENPHCTILELMLLSSREDKRFKKIFNLAKQQNVAVRLLDKKAFKAAFPNEAQGFVARLNTEVGLKAMPEAELGALLDKTEVPFILLLDAITSPHNLGACLRSADAAGVDLVIAPKDKSVGLTEAVAKVACGAAEYVPFMQVTNLSRTIDALKARGIWVYGAAGEAEKTLYDTDLKGPLALVMGSEEKGLRRLTRDHCDGLFKIPMLGHVSSLNVSVACGVSLFEARRQRD